MPMMELKIYERIASIEELDRDPSESERAQADIDEQGVFDETGGTLGVQDFEDAVANS